MKVGGEQVKGNMNRVRIRKELIPEISPALYLQIYFSYPLYCISFPVRFLRHFEKQLYYN